MKSIQVAFIHKYVDMLLLILILLTCRQEVSSDFDFVSVWNSMCLRSWQTFIFICDMFNVLYNRVCVNRVKRTIAKMLCIFNNQGSIFLAALCRLFLLLSHKVFIAFFFVLHSAVVAWFFIGYL